jgi:hypothetical protein
MAWWKLSFGIVMPGNNQKGTPSLTVKDKTSKINIWNEIANFIERGA